MERCRNITCQRPIPNNTYFYCCNPYDHYCEACSLSYICKTCRQFPSHRATTSKSVTHRCDQCLSTVALVACGCRVMCDPCTRRSASCLRCNKIYIPIQGQSDSNLGTGYQPSSIQTNHLDQSRRVETGNSRVSEKPSRSPKINQPQK